MGVYATGIKSKAICERCGFKVPFQQLTTEWNGLRVCPECWEPKHPQLTPRTAADAQAIYQPRPGEHGREDATVRIWRGLSSPARLGEINPPVVSSTASPTGVQATSALGDAEIKLIVQGLGITSSIGDVTVPVVVTGEAITSALGDEAIIGAVVETGEAITSALGTVTPTVLAGASGQIVSTALGDEWGQVLVLETGLAITSAVGTVAVDIRGWGNESWGDNGWGE